LSKAGEPNRVPDPQLPKKRRSAASRVIVSLFLIGLAGALIAGAAVFYGYREYNLPGPLAANQVFVVDKGQSTPEIAARLEDAGIISDARVFSAMATVNGSRSRLKAGEYDIAAGASMHDVMMLIASGKSIVYKLSVPEGWTSSQVVARVMANEVLTGDVSAPPPEGAVMPDTYVFKRGMTRQKLIDDMQAAQTKLLGELWNARRPVMPVKTKEEALILASIVEKETGKAEERPAIASVFINRLDKGMRLQSDPTIIYGITLGKEKLDRGLTRRDIETPTPYNTYTINGLPPGPIANPGRAAIEAVTNPPQTDYLYFVADGSGGHAFAKTLEEHNRNVANWRKLANGAASAAAEPPAPEQTAEPPAAAVEAQAAAEPAPAAAAPMPEPDAAAQAPAAAAPKPEQQAAVEPVPQDQTAATTAPAADAAEQAAAADSKPPEPGTVIKVGKKLTVIPMRKPKR